MRSVKEHLAAAGWALSPPRASVSHYQRLIPDAMFFRSFHEVMVQRHRIKNHAEAEGAAVPPLQFPPGGSDGS